MRQNTHKFHWIDQKLRLSFCELCSGLITVHPLGGWLRRRRRRRKNEGRRKWQRTTERKETRYKRMWRKREAGEPYSVREEREGEEYLGAVLALSTEALASLLLTISPFTLSPSSSSFSTSSSWATSSIFNTLSSTVDYFYLYFLFATLIQI